MKFGWSSAVAALIAVCFLAGAGVSLAQSLGPALRALERLEAGVEQGMSFQDYVRFLKKAEEEIGRLEAAGRGRPEGQAQIHLKAAWAAYDVARGIWSEKFTKFDDPQYQRNHEWFLSEREFEQISRRFPFLNDPELRRTERIGGDPSFTNVYREVALSALWKEASRELDRARSDIKRPPSRKH